mgnify:CR=1 FL=1
MKTSRSILSVMAALLAAGSVLAGCVTTSAADRDKEREREREARAKEREETKDQRVQVRWPQRFP